MMRAAMLCCVATLAASPALAGDGPAEAPWIWHARPGAIERPGLTGAAEAEGPQFAFAVGEADAAPAASRSISPALAGLLSAVVPGAGQLAQGQNRGWIYLGVEVVTLFSVWGLRAAGDQAEEDYREYADVHWAWDRYETAASCGDGLGPVDFEREREALREVYESARDQYYEDIGRLNVYACGWDALARRDAYEGMRADANGLFSAARTAVTAAFLNHVVSAVDAAKSASNRRKQDQAQALRLNWMASRRGDLALRVELARSF